MLALTLSLTLALTPTLTPTKEFTALCHYAYLNGIQRSTYELIAVVVSMVTFAVHSLRGLPLELGTVMPALLLFQPTLTLTLTPTLTLTLSDWSTS